MPGMLDVEYLQGGVTCSHMLVLIMSELIANELGELLLLKLISDIKPPGERKYIYIIIYISVFGL